MNRGQDNGFTLMEVLVALSLLSVGLLALAMTFPILVRLGNRSKVAGGALQMAQRELEQVRRNIFAPSGTFTDMDGNTLDGNCTTISGCGNTLTANGMIDYSAAPAVGYSAQLSDASGQPYSVRWRVIPIYADRMKIILEANSISPPLGMPVHLETIAAR